MSVENTTVNWCSRRSYSRMLLWQPRIWWGVGNWGAGPLLPWVVLIIRFLGWSGEGNLCGFVDCALWPCGHLPPTLSLWLMTYHCAHRTFPDSTFRQIYCLILCHCRLECSKESIHLHSRTLVSHRMM